MVANLRRQPIRIVRWIEVDGVDGTKKKKRVYVIRLQYHRHARIICHSVGALLLRAECWYFRVLGCLLMRMSDPMYTFVMFPKTSFSVVCSQPDAPVDVVKWLRRVWSFPMLLSAARSDYTAELVFI